MTSYGSHQSGSSFLHSYYPPKAAPPYPITPAASPQPSQSSRFYPPPLHQQHQSPPPGPLPMPPTPCDNRRSSSHSSTHRPTLPIPIPNSVRPPLPQNDFAITPNSPPYALHTSPPTQAQYPPVYARSSSHASYSPLHDPYYAGGENRPARSSSGAGSGRKAAETEREHERRHRRERVQTAERRPTLGDSMLSMVGTVGKVLRPEKR